MARPGLTKHRKFLRLARALGNAPLALGCLEFIWSQCYENGEDYLGDQVDVEMAAQWPGEPGALCKALLEAGGDGNTGFIEPVEDRPGHYRCHDLYDHAPEYVRKRMDRETARREAGITLREIRAAAAKVRHLKGKEVQPAAPDQQTDANGGHLQTDGSKCRANGTPPAPAPAPTPNPEEKIKPTTRKRAGKGDTLEEILGGGKDTPTWEAYWRLVTTFGGQAKNPAPKTTARLYAQAIATGTTPEQIQTKADILRGQTEETRYMPQLQKWLEGQGYLTPDLPTPTPPGGPHAQAPGRAATPHHRSASDDAFRQQVLQRRNPRSDPGDPGGPCPLPGLQS